jgi:hypothetical protein
MNVKLTRIVSNHENLRTNSIVGKCIKTPRIHHRFLMTSEPLNKDKDIRFVLTSVVQKVHVKGNKYTFHTENSKYELEMLDDI